jgi:hypothetical protein
VNTNGFNNTNYSGGMYSHANHIWTIGIFYLFGFFSTILVFASGKLALTRRFWGIGTGYVDTHWVGKALLEKHELRQTASNNILG